jgi:hypothetical protein
MFLYLCKMKRVFSYGLLIIVAVMYVSATMGFGVHVCLSDGATETVLLVGGPCCHHSHTHDHAHIHHHSHSCDACCDLTEYTASEFCSDAEGPHCCAQEDGCEVSVYVLGTDQNFESKLSLSAPVMAYLADLPDEMACPLFSSEAEAIYWSDPPPLLGLAAFLLPLRL